MFISFQAPLSLAGRILLAFLFLASGISKIKGFDTTVSYISSKGLPMPETGAVLACALEIMGALALLLGWKSQWFALLLAVFTLLAGILFHNFWAAAPNELQAQQVQFLKNICIAGGLLTLAAWGPGPWSLDARAVQP